jgi:hypothetical protein
VKVLSGVGVLVAVALAASACGGGQGISSNSPPAGRHAPISARTITSSGRVLDGQVVCTATANSPVQAGQDIDVTFSLHNVSSGPVKAAVGENSVWLVVHAADGTTYDTRAALRAEGFLGGPYRPPVTIRPGATSTMHAEVAVRWRGPLRITPGCEDAALPTLQADVTAPGPAPDEATAVSDVVASSGHLLDRCRPQQAGVAVRGEIDPPHPGAPPMSATCSVTVHSEGAFLVAQELVLIPPDLQGARISQPYEVLSLPKLPPPYEAIAWQFVVTKDGATTVAGMTRDATKTGNRMAPGWDWSGSHWNGPDSSRCGYEGLSGGPSIDFIDVCPS